MSLAEPTGKLVVTGVPYQPRLLSDRRIAPPRRWVEVRQRHHSAGQPLDNLLVRGARFALPRRAPGAPDVPTRPSRRYTRRAHVVALRAHRLPSGGGLEASPLSLVTIMVRGVARSLACPPRLSSASANPRYSLAPGMSLVSPLLPRRASPTLPRALRDRRMDVRLLSPPGTGPQQPGNRQ